MVKCPETLPEMALTEAQWDELSVDLQEAIRAEVLGQWASVYFQCAGTHNRLIDEIEK